MTCFERSVSVHVTDVGDGPLLVRPSYHQTMSYEDCGIRSGVPSEQQAARRQSSEVGLALYRAPPARSGTRRGPVPSAGLPKRRLEPASPRDAAALRLAGTSATDGSSARVRVSRRARVDRYRSGPQPAVMKCPRPRGLAEGLAWAAIPPQLGSDTTRPKPSPRCRRGTVPRPPTPAAIDYQRDPRAGNRPRHQRECAATRCRRPRFRLRPKALRSRRTIPARPPRETHACNCRRR
jgi:hypothetical protein